MEEARVLKTSHETRVETSIDGNHKPSIDAYHETESDARAKDDADFGYLRPNEWYFQRFRRTSMCSGFTSYTHL